MKIKITADRMIDLSIEELKTLGISTISCYVNLAGESYSDLDDIFPEDIFTHFEKHGELAKTAAKSPEIYYEFFEQFTKNGDAVIHFACSSGISAICNNAKIAASRLNNVYVIDTLALSNGIALLAKYAISLISDGETNIQKIYELCMEKRSKVQGAFIIESLDFLYKGGRCSGMQFFAAKHLRIRPVIGMNEKGQMKVREKQRGNYRNAISRYIKSLFEKNTTPDLKQIYFVHFSKDETIEDFVIQEVAKYHKFENIQISASSCNCAIHSGRNTVGLFFLNK